MNKEEQSDIKELIQDYLLDERLLRAKLPNDDKKLEFGYQFVFPPGPNAQNMVVFQPKDKNMIIISNPIQISPQHVKALNSLEQNKRIQFYMDLRKFFLAKDVFFRIEPQNNRYEISDQIFLEEESQISKNSFFRSIRKVFTSAAYSNMLLAEYCYGKIKPEELSKTKEFTSDFSLYS